jgi:hypothetical protein
MHFCAQRVANPVHRFLGQFKMLFLRVLHLVVTDAVQALHKHHDDGNAGARDLGRVVERTGRRCGVAPVSANRLIGQSDETS